MPNFLIIVVGVGLYMASMGIVFEALKGTALENANTHSTEADEIGQHIAAMLWPIALPLYLLYTYRGFVWAPVDLGMSLVVGLRSLRASRKAKAKIPKAEVVSG